MSVEISCAVVTAGSSALGISAGFSPDIPPSAPIAAIATLSSRRCCSKLSEVEAAVDISSSTRFPTSKPQPSLGDSFQELLCDGEGTKEAAAALPPSTSPSSSVDLPHLPLPVWPSSLAFHLLALAFGSSFGSFHRVLVGGGGGASELVGSFHRPLRVRSTPPEDSLSTTPRPWSDVPQEPPKRDVASPPASWSCRENEADVALCSSACASRPDLRGGPWARTYDWVDGESSVGDASGGVSTDCWAGRHFDEVSAALPHVSSRDWSLERVDAE